MRYSEPFNRKEKEMKHLFKRKKKMTNIEREMLCGEIVAVAEAYLAIIVIGGLLIAVPICIIGGLVEFFLKLT
jgi:hypothetical protein